VNNNEATRLLVGNMLSAGIYHLLFLVNTRCLFCTCT